MKKIAILLVMSMMFSITACGKKEVSPSKENTKTESKVEDTAQDSNKDNKEDVSSTEESVDSVAKVLANDFKNIVKDTKEPQKLADTLLTNEVIKFKGATMPVEQGPLNGFSEDIKGFEKGVMFSPMIGTIPFVGYIFTVPEGEDVNKFVETLKNTANQRWNVCTAADETVVEAVENTVFFVMSPTKFEE